MDFKKKPKKCTVYTESANLRPYKNRRHLPLRVQNARMMSSLSLPPLPTSPSTSAPSPKYFLISVQSVSRNRLYTNVYTQRSYRSFEFQLRIIFFLSCSSFFSLRHPEVPIVYRQPTFNDVPFSSLPLIIFFFCLLFFPLVPLSRLSVFIRFMFVYGARYLFPFSSHSTIRYRSPRRPTLTCPQPRSTHTMYCGTPQLHDTFNLNTSIVYFGWPKKRRFCALLTLSFLFPGWGGGRENETRRFVRQTNLIWSITGHSELRQLLTFQSRVFPFARAQCAATNCRRAQFLDGCEINREPFPGAATTE